MSARNIGRLSWWVAVLVGLVLCGVVLWRQKSLNVIYLDQKPLIVETASSEKMHEKGLSGRNQLPKGHGMIFDFGGPSNDSCIWMKDMRFAIDAYWFDAQGRLLTAKTGLKPESFPAISCPDLPASYLLEVPTGQYLKTPQRLTLPIYQ